MLLSKEDYPTEEERAAWERGRALVLEHRGPKNPVHQALDEAMPGTERVAIHPLSMDLLRDELGLGKDDFERESTPCEIALLAGFFSALLNGAAGADR